MNEDPGKDPGAPLLEVRGLTKAFTSGGVFGARTRFVAVHEVGFRMNPGEAIALVGESGSGKSTIARLMLRLDQADEGEIRLSGRDVLKEEPRRASMAYRRRVQMVFQDPFGSLNPVHSVAHHLVRPLRRHRRMNAEQARAEAIQLLRTTGLEPAEDFIDRHPYELSGGQRQRVAIARALAVEPDLLVADEPTSMLDVSIRMGVLKLLEKLKKERQLAILLITHDLASARFLADRVLVLYRGHVVEEGAIETVVGRPAHPYTRALLASIAFVGEGDGPEGVDRADAKDGVVDPPPPSAVGCPFVPRCPEVHDRCHVEDPEPRPHDGRNVRCHLYPVPPVAAAEAAAR